MNLAIQVVIVTVLVAAAMVFAAWRLVTAALRLRAIEALLRLLAPADPAMSRGVAAWLQGLAARQRTATGCAACDSNAANRKGLQQR
jgi:hypothetical protein